VPERVDLRVPLSLVARLAARRRFLVEPVAGEHRAELAEGHELGALGQSAVGAGRCTSEHLGGLVERELAGHEAGGGGGEVVPTGGDGDDPAGHLGAPTLVRLDRPLPIGHHPGGTTRRSLDRRPGRGVDR
jgi:hypothetical protein